MNPVAIVTGAAGEGIGRSIAFTLARDGYSVIVNYRSSKQAAESIVDSICSGGGNAVAIKADVFQQDHCRRLISETVFAFDRIDACIICPGADWHPEPPEKLNAAGALADITNEVAPIFYLISGLVPEMKKMSSGRLISIASNPSIPSPSYAYNTAKNARIDAMMGLASPLWKHRITANVIAPGPIEHLRNKEEALQLTQKGFGNTQKVTPQDVAETVSFLCSPAGRFVTGNVIELRF